MTVYVDLYFILNFLLDFFAILICHRILGYRRSLLRILLAALLGASYSLVALQFSSSLFVFLHLAFGALMVLIACGYGSLRRYIRLLLLFFAVCFLLGGAVTAVGRGIANFKNTGSGSHLTLTVVLITALFGGLLALLWGSFFPTKHPKSRTVLIKLQTDRACLSFQAYADTGNLLRDPLENTPVVLANASLSKKVFALYSDMPPPDHASADPVFYENMPLRLIPCDTVGGKTILPALKFTNATLDGVPRPLCIALNFSRNSDYCNCPALAPADLI